jgi:hypothetical protein
MPNREAKTNCWQIVVLLTLVVLLLWNTGLATDDYVHLYFASSHKVSEYLIPSDYVSAPLLHYTHGLAFFAIGDHLWAYDLLKAFYGGLSVYFATRFFALFFPPLRALTFGFMFIFLPFHDGASFWLTGQYLILSFTFYLFAYVQGVAGRYSAAVFWASLASFASYGSPPVAVGLSLLAALKRRWQHAASLLVPNLLYLIYYLATSVMLQSGTQRLTGEFNINALAKQFTLQSLTFIDSAVGPSAWAKIVYSLTELDGHVLLISLALAAFLVRLLSKKSSEKADRHLAAASVVILLLAFGMFALTGLYPQLAFSLGNRIMIYGGFFMVCLMAIARLPRWAEMGMILVLCFAIGGVSSHWKRWNQSVERVAANIRAHEGFRTLAAGSRLYVSGHQYSRLGPYSHIDFFTADYVVQTFFMLQLGNNIPFRALSFNRRMVFEGDSLRDRKYGDTAPVADGIWLYDSERNALEWVASAEIPARLQSLPDETRHWTQQLGDGWLKTRLLEAVPRLRYAY